jgi:ribonucleoside-triphosphate reductase
VYDVFKIKFDPKKQNKKSIISPEDLLPKTVENTRGELMKFDPQKIIESLIEETDLDNENAIKVATNVLRRLGGLGLEFIAAPHLRELVCAELTNLSLHEYRNKYTRLGIPIYDVAKMLKKQNGTTFSTLLTAQVIEQYVHLDRLSEDATYIIEQISEYAKDLKDDEKNLILNSMENALKLYTEKKKQHLV